MSAIPTTPARIVDPTLDRDRVLLTAAEREALRPRLLNAGHVVVASVIVVGSLLTLGVIKLTCGVPIHRQSEVAHVRAAAVRAAFAQFASPADTSVLCVALEGRADPGPAVIDALVDLDTLVAPASACEQGVFAELGRKRWVTVRHIDWQWGGRAVVTAASDKKRDYYLRRRHDGWHLVAVRPRAGV